MARTVLCSLEWRGRYSEPRFGSMWIVRADPASLYEERAIAETMLNYGGPGERNDAALTLLVLRHYEARSPSL